MSISIEALSKMSDLELLGAYYEVRRQFVEKKFARDTQLARLQWMRAKMFVTSHGGVSERNNAIDASEELGRKGQEVREMTRDLDLLKLDVDVVAMLVRLRGAAASKPEEPGTRRKERRRSRRSRTYARPTISNRGA
jgi:hypothetical protein